jgi:hypothetical protein
MVLKYMTLNVGSAKSEVTKPEKNSGLPSPKSKVQFCLLLVANIIVLTLVYNLWASGGAALPIWEFLTTNRGMVTGIMYNPENPCAIIGGEVVYEGETIGGYRVIKIHRDRVELEKNGKRVTEQVQ